MNYTIIGYTEGFSTFDRCGDLQTKDSDFTILTFRDDRAAFITAWAQMSFNAEYDRLIIMFDGIDFNDMSNEEEARTGARTAFNEMLEAQQPLKLAHEQKQAAERERLALAAEARARELAREQKERDLAQFEALKKKLGVSL